MLDSYTFIVSNNAIGYVTVRDAIEHEPDPKHRLQLIGEDEDESHELLRPTRKA
jgi:hypothetical protein